MAPKNILVLGGRTGCVACIIQDFVASKPDEYKLIVAGRTAPDSGIEFVPFDLFEENATQNLAKSMRKFGKIHAVINCISTGGKVSYDTTMIPYLNYVATNALTYLAENLGATLVHMSSLKVGNPEDSSPKTLERNSDGKLIWSGPRSPYAWSKLAAEQKLLLSDVEDMSFIRIGLMDTIHGRKFYTRVRTYVNFPVKVTTESDLNEAIAVAIDAKGRHTVSVAAHVENNGDFYSRMAGRWCFPGMPVWVFNYVFAHLIPTKLIDYCDPGGDFTYTLPL